MTMNKIKYAFVWNDDVVATSRKSIQRWILNKFSVRVAVNWFEIATDADMAAMATYRVQHVEETLDPIDQYSRLQYGEPIFHGDVVEQSFYYEDLPLDQAKDQGISQIKAIRAEIEKEWPVTYDGFIFQAADASVTTMQRTVDLLRYSDTQTPEDAPHTQHWRDINNDWRGPYNADQIEAMAFAKGLQAQEAWSNFAVLEGLIQDVSSVYGLRDLDLDAGWPVKPE